jgi:protein-S-isoprenylcysteine O-methyltransferase Ste14
MKPSNMNITPVPKPGGQLVTHGIYRIIRHPMYIAQLLVVGALVAEYFSFLRLAVLLILTVNLILKLNFEEARLVRHFEGYETYRQSTWRLIPYLY